MTVPAATAPRRAGGPLARVDELLGREVSLRALWLLRVLVGPIVVLHLAPFLSDSLHGRTYQDVFHEPYASWYPELPEGAYIGVLWLGATAAVAMSLGALARLSALTRIATVTTFAVVAYNLFLSTTHFHNNRAYLVIVLGILAMAPVAQAVPRGRCGCSGSSAPRSTGRPGSASWSIRIGSEGRSHGSASSKHATTSTRCPTGPCRSSPTGTSIPERPRRSS